MPTLAVAKGQSRRLPTGKPFLCGLGWDVATAGANVDLDLMVLRYTGKDVTPIVWANKELERPDLGQTTQGMPWLATPEMDVIHHGDDRTGAESKEGYDEIVELDTSRAPAGTTRYAVFASNWTDPDERDPQNPHTLGEATNVSFGITQEGTQNELKVNLADEHPFDVTVLIATIDLQPDGSWTLTHVADPDAGTTDDLVEVATKAIAAAANA